MAALANAAQTVGVVATGTIGQYNAITAAGAVATAAGNAIGFAQTGSVAGARIPTTALGIAVATAGAAIAVGAAVEVGAAGKVVTKAAGIAIGRAMSAAAADGDQIEIFVIPN
jgi:Uncharacterized conserved protein (DUF2190)